jgi:hypothetical protein
MVGTSQVLLCPPYGWRTELYCSKNFPEPIRGTFVTGQL